MTELSATEQHKLWKEDAKKLSMTDLVDVAAVWRRRAMRLTARLDSTLLSTLSNLKLLVSGYAECFESQFAKDNLEVVASAIGEDDGIECDEACEKLIDLLKSEGEWKLSPEASSTVPAELVGVLRCLLTVTRQDKSHSTPTPPQAPYTGAPLVADAWEGFCHDLADLTREFDVPAVEGYLDARLPFEWQLDLETHFTAAHIADMIASLSDIEKLLSISREHDNLKSSPSAMFLLGQATGSTKRALGILTTAHKEALLVGPKKEAQ